MSCVLVGTETAITDNDLQFLGFDIVMRYSNTVVFEV